MIHLQLPFLTVCCSGKILLFRTEFNRFQDVQHHSCMTIYMYMMIIPFPNSRLHSCMSFLSFEKTGQAQRRKQDFFQMVQDVQYHSWCRKRSHERFPHKNPDTIYMDMSITPPPRFGLHSCIYDLSFEKTWVLLHDPISRTKSSTSNMFNIIHDAEREAWKDSLAVTLTQSTCI